MLGPNDDRPRARRQALEVHELLERAGCHHALGTRTGHEPRRARALATAGGEHHGRRLELLAPTRSRELERPAR